MGLGKSKFIRYIDKDNEKMQDKERFETLFRNHYGQMLRLAMLLLKDDEEARDVVSDVFTSVGRNR